MQEEKVTPDSPLVIHSPPQVILEKDYPPSTPIKDINGELARSLYINGIPAFSVENGDHKAVFDSAHDHDKAKQILSEKLGVDKNSIFINSLFQGIEIYALASYSYIELATCLAAQSSDLMVTARQDADNGIFDLLWQKEKNLLIGTNKVGINFVRFYQGQLPDHIELTVIINVQIDEVSGKPKISREKSVLCNFSTNPELLAQMKELPIFKGFKDKEIINLISGFITQAMQSTKMAEYKSKPDKKLFKFAPKSGTTPKKIPSATPSPQDKKAKPTPLPKKVKPQKSKPDGSTDFFKEKTPGPTVWIRISSYQTAMLLKYQQNHSDRKNNPQVPKIITLASQKEDFSKRLGSEFLEIKYHGYDGYALSVSGTEAEAVGQKILKEVTDNLPYAFEKNKKDAVKIPKLLETVLSSAQPLPSRFSALTDIQKLLNKIDWSNPNVDEMKAVLDQLKLQRIELEPTGTQAKSAIEDRLFKGLIRVINELTITYNLNNFHLTNQKSLAPGT